MTTLRTMLQQVWRGIKWLPLKFRRSLQFQTVVVMAVVTLLAISLVAGFLATEIAQNLFRERLQQAQTNTTQKVNQIQNYFSSALPTDNNTLVNTARSALAAVNEEQGDPIPNVMVVAPSQPNILSISSIEGGLTSNDVPDELRKAVQQGEVKQLFWRSVPITKDGDRRPGLMMGSKVTLANTKYEVYMLYNLSRTQNTLDSIQAVLWASSLALVILVALITWYVTRTVVRPVKQASEVAQKLSGGDLEERMDAKGSDEMARLADSFNQMADSLQNQITQLATLSRMQQNFVSDVSHELRTPLTTVRMAAQVIYDARKDFPTVTSRSAELLYNQVERFQSLLADLLEISRFDAGAAALNAEPADILGLVRQVIEAEKSISEKLGTRVRVVSLLKDGDSVIEMDQARVERILRNLLLNAIEHSEKFDVEVYVAEDEDTVAVAVRDHGVGMNEEELSRVFDRFWRADPARPRTTGGTGLGMAIALEDTLLHHGWLDVWGYPQEGACFRLTLPKRQDLIVKSSPLGLPPQGLIDTQSLKIVKGGVRGEAHN